MGWAEEIDHLKREAAVTINKITLLKIIDRLGEFANSPLSEQAIDVICFIITRQKDNDIKLYALEVINQMRGGKNNISKYRNLTK